MVVVSTVLSPAFSAPAHATTVPVLVAHWKFDETSIGAQAEDSIGTNDGTPGTQGFTDPTPSTDVPTVSFTNTRSAEFNGDNYFTINNPVSTDFTICAWVKTTSTGGGTYHWESAPIMDAEWGGVAYDFGFGIGNGGKLMFGNGGDPVGSSGLFDAQIDGATSIDDNAWHNVCSTRSNTTGDVNLYVDAVLDGSGTTGVGPLTIRNVARIGWGYDGAALYQGLIDDVRVYDGVLNLSQLQRLTAGYATLGPPVVELDAPTASSVINTWTPAVDWGVSDQCAYSWNNSTWTTVVCANNGSDIAAPSSNGSATLYVRGNVTGDSTYGTDSAAFVYDTVAPAVEAGVNKHVGASFALSAATATDATSGIASVAWTKQSGPGTVTFSNAGTLNPSVTAISQSGTYVLRLTATDNAGNTAHDDVTVIWDTTKPDIAWSSGGFPDASTDKTTAKFVFTGSDALSAPVTYLCKLDTGTFVSCTSSVSLDKLTQGGHSFTVRATDAIGNTDDLTYAWTVVATQGNDQNGDGVVDAVQENVTSFASVVTNKTVALQVDANCSVEEAVINAEAAYTADPGFDYPQGLFDFTVDCGASGFTTTVTQYYYDISPDQLSLRKYNPVTKKYAAVGGATITTSNVYGKTVTVVSYQVTDGGPLDADGVANGVIVDPAGLAVPVKLGAIATLAKTGGSYLGLLALATGLCTFGLVIQLTRRRR